MFKKCCRSYEEHLPGLFESVSALLLALDEAEDMDGEDVTTMDTPGEGAGLTGK